MTDTIILPDLPADLPESPAADPKAPDPLDGLLDRVTLDEVFKRMPSEIDAAERKRLVRHFRAERARWEEKQKAKGKDE